MHAKYTAIIHLHGAKFGELDGLVEPLLQAARGVDDVQYDSDESLLTARFDAAQTSLAEIVRLIEDAGAVVSSVAQRRVPQRLSA